MSDLEKFPGLARRPWLRAAWYTWYTPVAAVLLLAAFAAVRGRRHRDLPYYSDETFTPRWMTAGSPELDSVPRVGAFALTDQSGAAFTERDMSGRVTVVNFFYSRCGDICPVTRGRLRRIAAQYASDNRVVLLSHTVTPHADSVARLALLGEAEGIDAKHWHMLTGADTTLQRLERDTYHLIPATAKSWGVDSIAHTERVLLVDQSGRIRGVYNGTLALEMENLRADLDLLLAAPH